ncbi:MAG TPA: nucleoside-diphosphate kinase [Candidatus Nanoarchaeia archaeon]|nr:nucleoside-diphosphate kinase [Candidatus Nanoarchaeia archaeon]
MRGFLLVKPDYVGSTWALISLAKSIIRVRNLPLLLLESRATPPIPQSFVEKFYEPHQNAPHFPRVVEYWSDKPTALLILEGPRVFTDTLLLSGSKTDPLECSPGELRYDARHFIPVHCNSNPNERKLRNIVHRSDSEENLIREMSLLRQYGL